MPRLNYKPVAPETFVSRVGKHIYPEEFLANTGNSEVSIEKVNFLESLWLAISEGDDSDTRATIYVLGEKAAFVRNTRDGQDFISLIDRRFEATIRELFALYETTYGYGDTSIVCSYEKVEPA
jgi:hypothetical protein